MYCSVDFTCMSVYLHCGANVSSNPILSANELTKIQKTGEIEQLSNQRAFSLTHNDQIKSSASDWCSDIQSMSPVFLNDSLKHYTCS